MVVFSVILVGCVIIMNVMLNFSSVLVWFMLSWWFKGGVVGGWLLVLMLIWVD